MVTAAEASGKMGWPDGYRDAATRAKAHEQ